VDAATPPPPGPAPPGRVTLARLNRAEYNNTVRDLLGIDTQPALDFPDDDHGYGYDRIADVLSTTPTHVALWQETAEALVDQVLDQPLVPSVRTEWAGDSLVGSAGAAQQGGWYLWSNGTLPAALQVDVGGPWRLEALAWSDWARGVPARMEFRVDGRTVASFDVDARRNAERVYEADVMLEPGTHTFAVAFTNDLWDPDTREDRNLFVVSMAAEGPVGLLATPGNPLRARWVDCDLDDATAGQACAASVARRFADSAWRRPLEGDAAGWLDRLLAALQTQGLAPADVLRGAMEGVLLSPRFVYRLELDPDPTDPTPRRLDDWEMASRLSYFLWSAPPDAALRARAAAGELQQDDVLRAEVTRMLADPRARALTDNFAGQWLAIRGTRSARPDPWIFPAFDDALRLAMVGEMEAAFDALVREDRPLPALMLEPDVWVNERLAAHYGIPGITGETLQRVDGSAWGRTGLLSRAGLLTALSYPHRTSPVLRGRWVLARLLCEEPPPAPAGVEGLPEDDGTRVLSLRERMAQHRADPACASCHVAMDPIGLGLERFDAVGLLRTHDASGWIDTRGELPDGTTFDGPESLAQVIADDPRFLACAVHETTTFALGRGLGPRDRAHLRTIEAGFRADGLSFRALVTAIVLSPPFRMRQGEAPTEADE
jgi:hypothetical protein